ncbi:unnamed protein product [Amoebophrya sp. A25]|nr:unnamed protein product [Amoebophrya sp. A25]|eukprot:GSA25T00005379001.1
MHIMTKKVLLRSFFLELLLGTSRLGSVAFELLRTGRSGTGDDGARMAVEKIAALAANDPPEAEYEHLPFPVVRAHPSESMTLDPPFAWRFYTLHAGFVIEDGSSEPAQQLWCLDEFPDANRIFTDLIGRGEGNRGVFLLDRNRVLMDSSKSSGTTCSTAVTTGPGRAATNVTTTSTLPSPAGPCTGSAFAGACTAARWETEEQTAAATKSIFGTFLRGRSASTGSSADTEGRETTCSLGGAQDNVVRHMEQNYIQLDFEVVERTTWGKSLALSDKKQLVDTWNRFLTAAIGPENRHAAVALLGCSVVYSPGRVIDEAATNNTRTAGSENTTGALTSPTPSSPPGVSSLARRSAGAGAYRFSLWIDPSELVKPQRTGKGAAVRNRASTAATSAVEKLLLKDCTATEDSDEQKKSATTVEDTVTNSRAQGEGAEEDATMAVDEDNEGSSGAPTTFLSLGATGFLRRFLGGGTTTTTSGNKATNATTLLGYNKTTAAPCSPPAISTTSTSNGFYYNSNPATGTPGDCTTMDPSVEMTLSQNNDDEDDEFVLVTPTAASQEKKAELVESEAQVTETCIQTECAGHESAMSTAGSEPGERESPSDSDSTRQASNAARSKDEKSIFLFFDRQIRDLYADFPNQGAPGIAERLRYGVQKQELMQIEHRVFSAEEVAPRLRQWHHIPGLAALSLQAIIAQAPSQSSSNSRSAASSSASSDTSSGQGNSSSGGVDQSPCSDDVSYRFILWVHKGFLVHSNAYAAHFYDYGWAGSQWTYGGTSKATNRIREPKADTIVHDVLVNYRTVTVRKRDLPLEIDITNDPDEFPVNSERQVAQLTSRIQELLNHRRVTSFMVTGNFNSMPYGTVHVKAVYRVEKKPSSARP